MKTFDTILYGATALSVGYAMRAAGRGQSCCVIEPCCLVGAEFGEAWYPAAGPFDYETEEAAAVAAELKRRDAIDRDGTPHLPALPPVLSAQLERLGCPVYFSARVLELIRDESAFKATILTQGTTVALRARRFVDTTSRFLSRGFFSLPEPELERSLSLLLTKAPQNCACRQGIYAEGFYAARPLLRGESYPEALLRMTREIHADPERWGCLIQPAQLLFEAPRTADCIPAKGAAYAPSTAKRHVFQALDAGAMLADDPLDGPDVQLRTLPVILDEPCDVCVAGLGTAGAVAACLAAERGLRVAGIENLPFPGGAGTAGSVMTYFLGTRESGYYREIDRRWAAFSDAILADQAHRGGGLHKLIALCGEFNRHALRAVWNASLLGVLRDGNDVRGIRYLAEDGVHELRAAVTIDCTGDGLACLLAGCEMQGGRPSDGEYTPFSCAYRIFDMDNETFAMSYTDAGVTDPYDPERFGRDTLHTLCDGWHLLSSYRPAENAAADIWKAGGKSAPKKGRVFMGSCLLTGLREGKRIIGEETSLLRDALLERYTPEPAFVMVSTIDGHAKDFAFEEPIVRDFLGIAGMWNYTLGIPLPAGILIPRGYTGLLTASRSLACDQGLSYGLRMMDDLSKAAECAAVLAEFSVRTGKPAREIPYEILRDKMRTYGALEERPLPSTERKNVPETYVCSAESVWLKDFGEILHALDSEKPDYALWSSVLAGSALHPLLRDALSSESPTLRLNAALALALRGEPDGKDVLIAALSDCSGKAQEGCYYCPPYVMQAIAACGKLGLEEALPELWHIFTDSEVWNSTAVVISMLYDAEDVAFQYRSYAFIAMTEILVCHPELQGEWLPRLKSAVFAPDFSSRSSTMGNPVLRCEMAESYRAVFRRRFENV